MTEPAGTPGAAAPAGTQDVEWWRDGVIYQIYPRSFVDSNGDGMGDLPGVASRLEYIADLGLDAIWLTPFYPSPQADGGYDVSDYCDVDPMFGTLADFDALLDKAHRLGLRVIVDLVANHTSDQHPWFRDALAAPPHSPVRDRYLFRTGRGPSGLQPPNNWHSLFGGPAWTRAGELTGRTEDQDQWYLHLFDSSQPDLNWDDTVVQREFEDVLRFWLDRGVDGFRVDVAHGMVKAPGLPDWDRPAAANGDGPVNNPSTGRHTPGLVDLGPMFDQPGVHDIHRRWHQVLAGYPGQRALVAEADAEPMSRIAAYVRPDEMQQAFNFAYLRTPWQAAPLRKVIDDSLAAYSAVGAPTTWVLSNHDLVRHASLLGLADTGRSPDGIGAEDEQPDAVLGLRRARAAILLTLALPGSAYLYQGEELGLPEHTTLDDELRQDPSWERSGRTIKGRDGCRVPLPWSAAEPAFGFSPNGKAWLPQPSDWGQFAADQQAGVEGSTLELYRSALRLRKERLLGRGSLVWWDDLQERGQEHLAFLTSGLLVIANTSAHTIDVPVPAAVLLSSQPLERTEGSLQLPGDTTVWLALDHGPVRTSTAGA